MWGIDLASCSLHSICLLKAGLHMRGCRHPKQEHKQHHAKICNEKTGVWPPPGRKILVGLHQMNTQLQACTVVSGRDAMAQGQRSRRASKRLPWRATSDRKKKDPSTEARKMPRWTWRTCPSPTWTLVALRRVVSRACEYRRNSRSATTPSMCTKPLTPGPGHRFKNALALGDNERLCDPEGELWRGGLRR